MKCEMRSQKSEPKNIQPSLAGCATSHVGPQTSHFENKVARHSTALGERRYRCYLPVLAEFTRLPMHGTWPARTMCRTFGGATIITGNRELRVCRVRQEVERRTNRVWVTLH